MASKTSKPASEPPLSAAGLFDNQLAGAVKASAQQIWLAGMGAFAKAQAEGTRVFDALVKEGVGLQRKTQPSAGEKPGEKPGEKQDAAADRVSSLAAEVGSKASASWDRLENLFEERTAKALRKLGVPTAAEVDALARRVDELAALVGKLSGPAAPPATPPAPATPSRKAAAPRKAPARKTAKPAAAAAAAAAAPPAPRKRAAKKAPQPR